MNERYKDLVEKYSGKPKTDTTSKVKTYGPFDNIRDHRWAVECMLKTIVSPGYKVEYKDNYEKERDRPGEDNFDIFMDAVEKAHTQSYCVFMTTKDVGAYAAKKGYTLTEAGQSTSPFRVYTVRKKKEAELEELVAENAELEDEKQGYTPDFAYMLQLEREIDTYTGKRREELEKAACEILKGIHELEIGNKTIIGREERRPLVYVAFTNYAFDNATASHAESYGREITKSIVNISGIVDDLDAHVRFILSREKGSEVALNGGLETVVRYMPSEGGVSDEDLKKKFDDEYKRGYGVGEVDLAKRVMAAVGRLELEDGELSDFVEGLCLRDADGEVETLSPAGHNDLVKKFQEYEKNSGLKKEELPQFQRIGDERKINVIKDNYDREARELLAFLKGLGRSLRTGSEQRGLFETPTKIVDELYNSEKVVGEDGEETVRYVGKNTRQYHDFFVALDVLLQRKRELKGQIRMLKQGSKKKKVKRKGD